MAQPNPTLYVHNLNDKVKSEELRAQLYALFTTYGKVIDIVATKGPRMRGQAFLVFSDLAAATTAMRACEGMQFYEKPLRIEYARAKSHITLRNEDPNFLSPAAKKAQARKGTNGIVPADKKRARDTTDAGAEREAKRGKVDDDEGEEMEIEDDEDQPQPAGPSALPHPPIVVPPIQRLPSSTLLCTNLPQEVTEDVLGVLFQQYQGFQSTQIVPSPHPAVVSGTTTNAKTKMAQVFYDSPELASTAKEALDGFALKKGWLMTVQFV